MKFKKLSFGIACLFMISFFACKKATIEPDDEPQNTVAVTSTGNNNTGNSNTGGTSSSQGNMEVMNGLYFGTYHNGFVPNISRIDSIYADVDSLGTTGYEVIIYSDRGLNDKIGEFKIRFRTLDFKPCDIGTPTDYSESWSGCGFHDEFRTLEVLDCNSIKIGRGTYGSGDRGGCPSFKIYGFTGERIR